MQKQLEKHVICRKDDLNVGERKIFELGRVKIALFRTKDGYFAIQNTCPHQGGPLGKGVVQGAAIPSKVGEYCYERKGQIVYCPWHHWDFDVTTGESIRKPDSLKIRTYQVEIEDDNVVIYK